MILKCIVSDVWSGMVLGLCWDCAGLLSIVFDWKSGYWDCAATCGVPSTGESCATQP